MTSYGASVAPSAGARRTAPAGRSLGTLLVAACVAGVALGVLAGWLWVVLSDPPRARLYSDGGIYLGEQALNQQSGVTLWFLVLGAAFGAAAGLLLSVIGARFGWLTVGAVLVLSVVGCIVSRYAGMDVFGSDPRAEAASASTGDLVRLGVQVDTWVAYLGWPIGGVLGSLGGIVTWSWRDTTVISPTLDSTATPPTDLSGSSHGQQHTPSGDAGRV